MYLFLTGGPNDEKRDMKRFLMIMVLALVFMANSAQAANEKLYISGNFAFGIQEDAEDGAVKISFDPGWGLIGALGYDAGKFRVEGEIYYRSFEIDEVTFPSSPPVSLNGDASVFGYMANGYYDFEMNSPLTPYAGFGLGLVKANIDDIGFGSSSDTRIAFQVMLGAGYEIGPATVLTGGYRFFGIGVSEVPDIHEFNVGARFMF